MAKYITLTKHPERLCGELGISMYFGAPAPQRIPKVHLQASHPDSAWTETFENNTIPASYYSARTDLIYVRTERGIVYSDGCFVGCTNLEKAVINGSSTIAASSFRGCSSLTSVTINTNGTQEIGDSAFADCDTLTSITLPSSLQIIGNYVFMGCSSLDSVILGSGLTQINQQCFANCISLLEITCTAPTAPTLGANVFRNVASDGTLYVPTGSDYSTWLAALPQNWTIEYI